MNERHRTAKRAQKDCSDLYLLLLLHAQVGLFLRGKARALQGSSFNEPRCIERSIQYADMLVVQQAACRLLAYSHSLHALRHMATHYRLPITVFFLCSRTWRRPRCTACAARPCSCSCPSTT